MLAGVALRLTNATVRVPMDQHPAKIHDDEARTFMQQVTDRTKNVSIKAGSETVTVPQNELLSWLDFAAPDSGETSDDGECLAGLLNFSPSN